MFVADRIMSAAILGAVDGPPPLSRGIPDNIAGGRQLRRRLVPLYKHHPPEPYMFVWMTTDWPKPTRTLVVAQPATQALTRQCRRQDERHAAKGRRVRDRKGTVRYIAA